MALNVRRAADGGYQNQLLFDTGTALLDLSPDVGTFSVNSNANVIDYNVQNVLASKRVSAGGVVEVSLDTLYYGASSRSLEDLSKSTTADSWMCVLSGKGGAVGALTGTRIFIGRAICGAQEISASAGDLMTATANFQQADVWYAGDKYSAFTTVFTSADLALPDYDSNPSGGREEAFMVVTSYTPASSNPVNPRYKLNDGTNTSAVITISRAGIYHFAADGAEPDGQSTVVDCHNASSANGQMTGFVCIVKRQDFN